MVRSTLPISRQPPAHYDVDVVPKHRLPWTKSRPQFLLEGLGVALEQPRASAVVLGAIEDVGGRDAAVAPAEDDDC